MRADSSFFTTQLFGSAAFAASDAEVVHAAAEVAAHRAPSFLAYMVARAFALSRPLDFTSDLGATQRLYVHGFTPTPPPVVQLNRPPEALSQAVTTAEDSAKAITLGAGDPDGNPLTFTVSSPGHGTLTGIAPNLTYTPAHDYDGPDSFTFTASDGSLTSATATVTITVTPIDDPPVITTSAGPLGSTDGGPATPVDAWPRADRPDSQITGATVRISGNHASPEDVLALASRPNITAAYDSATGTLTLTLTGTDTVADYQAALRAVTYRNTSGNPSTLTRTVTFLASDASSTSAPATRDIDISPSDNAPDVVGSAGSLTYAENASPTAIDVGLTVTDPDSVNLTGATVRITTGYALGEDVLALPAQPAITGGFDAPTGVLTLTARRRSRPTRRRCELSRTSIRATTRAPRRGS